MPPLPIAEAAAAPGVAARKSVLPRGAVFVQLGYEARFRRSPETRPGRGGLSPGDPRVGENSAPGAPQLREDRGPSQWKREKGEHWISTHPECRGRSALSAGGGSAGLGAPVLRPGPARAKQETSRPEKAAGRPLPSPNSGLGPLESRIRAARTGDLAKPALGAESLPGARTSGVWQSAKLKAGTKRGRFKSTECAPPPPAAPGCAPPPAPLSAFVLASPSSRRLRPGGLRAAPDSARPFPARKHASVPPRALEGAARLKPGEAAPRSAKPRRRRRRCRRHPPAGSPAAPRRGLKLGVLGRPRPLPAPSPGASRKPRFSAERIVPGVALFRGLAARRGARGAPRLSELARKLELTPQVYRPPSFRCAFSDMRRLLEPCWWILFLKISSSVLHYVVCFPALTEGYVGAPKDSRRGSSVQIRRRKASGDPYWAYSGAYGPEHWVTSSVSCGGRHQSPIDILDHQARVGEEYQELQLDGFDSESSNKTWMKNTGKTVAILLKDDYFVSGAGLPGRFKAEKVEFHWGHSNGSAGSEHSVNGRRFPVEMQIFFYNPDDFDSFQTAISENRIIGAMAIFFQVSPRDNSALDPIIHGLKGVVHHEKETFLDPFVLRDLLPASLGSYYRYTGSLTTPPCSEIVEWIVFQKPVPISYHQLEAFYSIFTTEQQDHVKSVEYLRNNFRPQQALNDRVVSKSAVRDAWSHDMADFLENPLGTEASKGGPLATSNGIHCSLIKHSSEGLIQGPSAEKRQSRAGAFLAALAQP
ncbi:receptor-type tyrosine-protein phosphatase gamma, partial [Heterocephalus glaber]|uniref:Receptor-type tyrosine-protein phosphatase gamma n=1 Tax=Heterocephalus glaber TaxID=10181 RepID=A0AAX6RWM0_HETGA